MSEEIICECGASMVAEKDYDGYKSYVCSTYPFCTHRYYPKVDIDWNELREEAQRLNMEAAQPGHDYRPGKCQWEGCETIINVRHRKKWCQKHAKMVNNATVKAWKEKQKEGQHEESSVG